jgi:hypothetical protein
MQLNDAPAAAEQCGHRKAAQGRPGGADSRLCALPPDQKTGPVITLVTATRTEC